MYSIVSTLNICGVFVGMPLPNLTDKQTLSCKGNISEDEVSKSLKSIDNNKSPGKDGLSKEFFKCF